MGKPISDKELTEMLKSGWIQEGDLSPDLRDKIKIKITAEKNQPKQKQSTLSKYWWTVFIPIIIALANKIMDRFFKYFNW